MCCVLLVCVPKENPGQAVPTAKLAREKKKAAGEAELLGLFGIEPIATGRSKPKFKSKAMRTVEGKSNRIQPRSEVKGERRLKASYKAKANGDAQVLAHFGVDPEAILAKQVNKRTKTELVMNNVTT
jgi:hypothetical protein